LFVVKSYEVLISFAKARPRKGKSPSVADGLLVLRPLPVGQLELQLVKEHLEIEGYFSEPEPDLVSQFPAQEAGSYFVAVVLSKFSHGVPLGLVFGGKAVFAFTPAYHTLGFLSMELAWVSYSYYSRSLRSCFGGCNPWRAGENPVVMEKHPVGSVPGGDRRDRVISDLQSDHH